VAVYLKVLIENLPKNSHQNFAHSNIPSIGGDCLGLQVNYGFFQYAYTLATPWNKPLTPFWQFICLGQESLGNKEIIFDFS
jgi:hypothetical protein